ncbi:MAG: sodium:solute symporter family protein [Verrucomicrobia bacterium]|jgi:SSS family solute:Na+ symporter|nr:sodium:solute symporter family protein [Verrucomicrobiota bacterium]
MYNVQLGFVDYAVLAIYVIAVVAIGFALQRYMKSSSDFLTSGRSIPAWVTGLAFISANLGALELVGMAASGAKYGIATSHFYWVGAIPAMIFLAVFMMPFYYGSKARSVPEYLKMRFDERVRALNSIAFAVMTVFASGISMNALAKLLNQLLGWNYHVALWVCSAVVLVYVLKGGLTSAIYTEVLQFFMIVLGFAPVVYLGLKDVGGWGKMNASLQTVAQNPMALNLGDKPYPADAWTSAWGPLMGGTSTNPMGVDLFAMVFGLGFVLSFGYWCTNFLVVQRAMAAKNMTAARRTPLIAAVPKMIFPILVIVPGMIAVALTSMPDKGYRIPPPIVSEQVYDNAATVVKASASLDATAGVEAVAKAIGKKMDSAKVATLLKAAPKMTDTEIKQGLYNAIAEYDYDGVILSLVKKYCPTGLLGLALTALLASFMSGMAGNVTAFNTVWTYDLYQAYIAPNKSDQHYFWMGRAITVVGILLSIACAYFAAMYNNAMDIIQLVFGFVNAPLFATFLLGMFWARTTGTGAFLGLFGGIGGSAIFHALTTTTSNLDASGHVANGMKGGYLGLVQKFPSEMAQNFWLASFAFIICLTLTTVISLATKRTKTDEELRGLVYSLTPKIQDEETAWYLRPATLGIALLVCCVILNIIFR